MKNNSHKIPNRLNILLVCGVLCVSLFLMWLASQLPLLWSIPIGVVLSFIFLTNYALMHDATHDALNSNTPTNNILGMVASWLFPMSFTMFKISHTVHHRCNRTDYEMFDYYYPTDNLLIKYAQWYSILIGIYWPIIPVGSLLMALTPWIYRTKPFLRAKTTAVLFKDFDSHAIRRIRIEVLGGIMFWAGAAYLLSLKWQSLVILYAFFAFNWSTRQYVTHAFTERDVINGALNLKVSRMMACILLNGHWDLVHHQHPNVPWLHLPKYAKSTRSPVNYWAQYLRLWKGPKPNFEVAPNALNDVPR